MLAKGDIAKLKIEKMVYEGYGLAHKDGLVYFVENVCDGDIVEAKISKIKKNYVYATLEKIIEPSTDRETPFCPLYKACGGCQWQHINYCHQLEIKQNIVKETLSKALGFEVEVQNILPSPKVKEFRHKIQMPVSQTKNSKRFLIGYYKQGSHEIVNIKYCPIQPQIADKITDKIRFYSAECGLTAYNEKTKKGELRHIILRISENSGDIIICFVVNNDKISGQISELAHKLYNEFSEVKGVSLNYNQVHNNVILGKKTENIIGDETYTETLNDVDYIISPESFFQINPSSFNNILNTVKNLITDRLKEPKILDAYSGVGSFGLYLSDTAKHVTCVEEVESACKNAKKACELNKINNVNIINGDAQNIFKNLIDKNEKFDFVILDPPRKGCTKETLDFCSKLTNKYIVYVSCNPNSLARDLKYLKQKGFNLSYVRPADMFCHTYHVETVTLVEKD